MSFCCQRVENKGELLLMRMEMQISKIKLYFISLKCFPTKLNRKPWIKMTAGSSCVLQKRNLFRTIGEKAGTASSERLSTLSMEEHSLSMEEHSLSMEEHSLTLEEHSLSLDTAEGERLIRVRVIGYSNCLSLFWPICNQLMFSDPLCHYPQPQAAEGSADEALASWRS